MAKKEPLKLQILKAMTTALQEINGGPDYWNDLSGAGQVVRGRTVFSQHDPDTMVTILEVPIPPEQMMVPTNARFKAGPWELFVQGWTKDDKQNPTDNAYYLQEDVTQRILQEKDKLLKMVDNGAFGFKQIVDIHLGQGVVRPDDERSASAYFWLPLTIDLVDS